MTPAHTTLLLQPRTLSPHPEHLPYPENAVGEFQRVAALLAQPGMQAPDAPPGPASGPHTTTTVPLPE